MIAFLQPIAMVYGMEESLERQLKYVYQEL
jgi:hypothetical protein